MAGSEWGESAPKIMTVDPFSDITREPRRPKSSVEKGLAFCQKGSKGGGEEDQLRWKMGGQIRLDVRRLATAMRPHS